MARSCNFPLYDGTRFRMSRQSLLQHSLRRFIFQRIHKQMQQEKLSLRLRRVSLASTKPHPVVQMKEERWRNPSYDLAYSLKSWRELQLFNLWTQLVCIALCCCCYYSEIITKIWIGEEAEGVKILSKFRPR